MLVDIRKDAKSKKDFSTSDKIRKQLAELGIEMKDEKDGSISWSIGSNNKQDNNRQIWSKTYLKNILMEHIIHLSKDKKLKKY